MSNRETFIATMRAQGCPDTWAFQDDGTGGFHNQLTEWAWIGWNRAIESQAAQIAALTAERDAARELADSEGSRAVDYLLRARRAEASLREVLELCAAGDVDESTEALGWGDAIRRANQALAARTQAHKPAIKGQTP